MKKLLIILMVVAVTSFLFVGCFDVTDPEIVIVDDEDDGPGLIPTIAPIITSVPDAADGYVNKAEAKDGLVVNGTAPTLSEVKVYINGLTAGTGDVTATGFWTVVVAKADLIKAAKTDGAKVLHATATDLGFPESDSSNKVEFTLDTKLPTIEKSSAKAGTPAVGGTAVATPDSAGTSIRPGSLNLIPANIVAGTWTVKVITQGVGPFLYQVEITDPDGESTPYSGLFLGGDFFQPNSPIPGVGFQLKLALTTMVTLPGITFADNVLVPGPDTIIGAGLPGAFLPGDVIIVTGSAMNDGTYTIAAVAAGLITLIATDTLATEGVAPLLVVIKLSSQLIIGQQSEIVCIAAAPAVPGYIDVTFDEAVTGLAAPPAGTSIWTAFGATVNLMPNVTVRSATEARLTETTTPISNLVAGVSYSVSVSGPTDLAGNSIPAGSEESSMGVVGP